MFLINPYRFGGGGGGSSLLTGLVDWWEDADATGQHNSNSAVVAASVNQLTGGVNGLDYWIGTTNPSSVEYTLPATHTGDFTIVGVLGTEQYSYDMALGFDGEGIRTVPYGADGTLDLIINGSIKRHTSVGTDLVGEQNLYAFSVDRSGSSVALYIRTSTTETDTVYAFADFNSAAASVFDVTKVRFMQRQHSTHKGMFYDRVLTSAEIDTLYNSGSFVTYSSL